MKTGFSCIKLTFLTVLKQLMDSDGEKIVSSHSFPVSILSRVNYFMHYANDQIFFYEAVIFCLAMLHLFT